MSKGVCRASSLCAPPDPVEMIEMNDLERFRAALAEDDSDPNRVVEAPQYASLLQNACKQHCKGAFVRALLEAGADPSYKSALREGRTAVHFAAREGNAAALRELLFASERKGAVADVNAIDSKGFTALHEVCNRPPSEEVKACLEVLLSRPDIRVNLTSRNGKTAIYLAASSKQQESIKRLLDYGALVDVDKIYNDDTAREAILRSFPGIFDKQLEGKPVAPKDIQLMDYLYSGNEDAFLETLEEMKDSTIALRLDTDDGSYTLLQKASMDGLSQVVGALLENGANPNKTTIRHEVLPTQLAARNGHCEVLKILLEHNAKITSANGTTALHCVVQEADSQSPRYKEYKDCFELLLKECKADMNTANDLGNTPLHLAAKYGTEEFVLALLKNGAYIGTENKNGIPPIANISAATLKKFLDGCVSNKRTPRDPNYRIIFNVLFLKPPSGESNRVDSNSTKISMSDPQEFTSLSNECECDPLLYISKLKDTKHVLTHPVFTSFLDIKWRGIRQFFWINLIIYLLFVCLLTIYILFFFEDQSVGDINELVAGEQPAPLLESTSSKMNKTEEDITATMLDVSRAGGIIWFLTTLLFLIVCLRELFQFIVAPKHYTTSLENYLEICLLVGTGLVLFYQSADSHIRPHISAITILLSWAELVLLIGKHPRLSTNIEMLKTVSFNFLEFLAWYSLLIIAFALSFFSMFRNSTEEDNFFLNPGSSFFKTVVMVTGEFEAGELPFVMFPGTSHIIFVLFVFLVAIVLFNLLNGLAVSDTQAIREDAELVGIISRIKLISYSERILLSHPFWCKSCQNKESCIFQAFTGLQKLSLSGLTAQVQKVRLFPHVLPDGVISVLPNQDREIEFTSTNAQYSNVPCYHPMCRYYIDSSVLKAAEKILESKMEKSSTSTSKCNHNEEVSQLHEKIQSLEKKVLDLSESSLKSQEMLQKVLELVQNSYNSQMS